MCILCLTTVENAEVGELRLHSVAHEHKKLWDKVKSDKGHKRNTVKYKDLLTFVEGIRKDFMSDLIWVLKD